MRFICPAPGKVLAGMSMLGLASLCYLAGAAVVHFQLPGSGSFRNAFTGVQAWKERGSHDGSIATSSALQNTVTVDQPDYTSDGFTLYTTNSGTWAVLIDMKGNLVHQW